jgi:hypothetical protein
MKDEDSDLDLSLAPALVAPPVKKTVRVYDNLNVQMSFQNCGSVWLMILRGSEAEIELAFNGLYNFGATGGRLDYTTHDKTTAKFWSNEESMYSFYYMRHYIKHNGQKAARLWAEGKMRELRQTCEQFYSFTRRGPDATFGVSTATAERPDTDFKDEKELTNA